MNVIDVVLVLLVIGVVALETKRGFGKAVFDFVALLIAVRISPLLARHLANAVPVFGDAPASQAFWFVAVFVVAGGILVFLGKLAYDATLISLDTFDPFLGGALGFGLAVIVGHVLVNALAISARVPLPGGAPPEILARSTLGMEFYEFRTYHAVINFLSSLSR